jgi:hypothetical protein
LSQVGWKQEKEQESIVCLKALKTHHNLQSASREGFGPGGWSEGD